jgi:hypothetical protein
MKNFSFCSGHRFKSSLLRRCGLSAAVRQPVGKITLFSITQTITTVYNPQPFSAKGNKTD